MLFIPVLKPGCSVEVGGGENGGGGGDRRTQGGREFVFVSVGPSGGFWDIGG